MYFERGFNDEVKVFECERAGRTVDGDETVVVRVEALDEGLVACAHVGESRRGSLNLQRRKSDEGCGTIV